MTDGRLLRGARSRQAITRHAVDVASLEGLNGLSLGRLATDLGLSKSGIQTLFRTKENLHLATIDTAAREFYEAVVAPALPAPEGLARLSALIDRWIVYAETPLFEGGCFWAANLPDFDSRPGPVRDALVNQHNSWRTLLSTELTHAIKAGELAAKDPEMTAFHIDAVLMATNTALRLNTPKATATARRIINSVVTS
ncbi:TetR/AcrR family transcriptional regulator [Actinomadura rudentiformis]|uniref:TetR/AcrR family transcriptional regulator n=1 Tax=Actinomadura rudentiformis TaxID=359158 RepID=A0A6H9YQG4_9ACTN|nr:TetR/AcrR family transcriptional regulator [Actinomadura rudentiformis]KAB2349657.1 TetR/AcrR family transcriptional regulator [Actinomadura rudentiformis]